METIGTCNKRGCVRYREIVWPGKWYELKLLCLICKHLDKTRSYYEKAK